MNGRTPQSQPIPSQGAAPVVTDRVSRRRYVIGGVDCTDEILRSVADAPLLTAAQLDQLRGLFREHRPAVAGRSKRRACLAAQPSSEAA